MDLSQLEHITTIFHDLEIEYWIDSGTLLSMTRERRLFPEDDIDISCFSSGSKIVLENLDIFKNDYDLRIERCRGILTGAKLYPENKDRRMVDIKFFESYETNLVTFVGLPIKNPFNRANPLYYIFGAPRHLLEKMIYQPLCAVTEPDLRKLRYGCGWRHEVVPWIIPQHYIKKPKYRQNWGVYIPSQTEQYLQYRYGDWEVEDKDWKTSHMDGALKHQFKTDDFDNI